MELHAGIQCSRARVASDDITHDTHPVAIRRNALDGFNRTARPFNLVSNRSGRQGGMLGTENNPHAVIPCKLLETEQRATCRESRDRSGPLSATEDIKY